MAGLLYAIHSTRSPVANQFRRWVCTTVFTIGYGTEDQKKKMVNKLCRIDKRFLQAFMKLVPNDIACLYLVDTTKDEQGKKVYKFGRSKKLKERFYNHNSTFGDGIILDTVIFVPEEYLSEAEARLNNSINESLRFPLDQPRELLLLNPSDYKKVRTTMQTIADKYNGNMTVHATVLKTEMKDQAFKYELRIKDLERMVDVLEVRIQRVATEEKSKVAVLQQQLDNHLENAALRFKVAEVEHAAQLAEKDRRIAEKDRRIEELEELIRRMRLTEAPGT